MLLNIVCSVLTNNLHVVIRVISRAAQFTKSGYCIVLVQHC